MPVTSSVATLTMPSVEKRSVAVRATASDVASLPAVRQQQRERNQRSDPRRRGDEMQHVGGRMNDAFDAFAADGVAGQGQRCRRAPRPESPRRSSSKARRRHSPTRAEQTCRQERRQPPSERTSRCRNRSATAPSVARLANTIRASGCPLIDAAVRTNQAAPDSTQSARLIQAIQAKRATQRRGKQPSLGDLRNAGSAMKTSNKTMPAAIMVAAK